MSALVRYEILGHFVNTFTTHDKYSPCSIQNLGQQIETPLSKKQNTFFNFLLYFWNLHLICNIVQNKMSLLA